MTRLLAVLVCLCAAAVACDRSAKEEQLGAPPATAPQAAAEGSATQRRSPLEFVSHTVGGKDSETLPWVIALHGLGDRPESFIGLLENAPIRAHVYAPRALYPHGDGFDWYRASVDGDPEALAHAMKRARAAVLGWMSEQASDPKNDGKPVLLGFSQGGMLSFALGTLDAERFKAVIPISGMLPRPLWPPLAQGGGPPIYALHGADDRIVPLGPTEALVQHLQQQKIDANLEVFPGVAHRIPGPVRTRLYELLAQSLGQ